MPAESQIRATTILNLTRDSTLIRLQATATLPVNRGILATVYADIKDGVTFEQIRKAYEDFYKDEFFVRLLDDGKCADIHNIKYSNFCDVSIHHDKRANKLVACAAIDNMVKGAAGQAIQNMNIIFGLDEKTGLVIVPPAF